MSRKTGLVSPQFTDVRHSLPIIERGAGQKLKHQCHPVTGGVDKKLPQRGRIYFFFNILNNVVKRKKNVVANHCCGYLKDAFPSLSSGVC